MAKWFAADEATSSGSATTGFTSSSPTPIGPSKTMPASGLNETANPVATAASTASGGSREAAGRTAFTPPSLSPGHRAQRTPQPCAERQSAAALAHAPASPSPLPAQSPAGDRRGHERVLAAQETPEGRCRRGQPPRPALVGPNRQLADLPSSLPARRVETPRSAKERLPRRPVAESGGYPCDKQ